MQDIVNIRILGQEYKVKAGGDENRIQSLSRYINEKVLDVQHSGNAISTMELVVIVMLSMADDVLNVKTELKTYKETIADRIDQIISYLDEGTK
ncbi:MAG: cell division protein ZapA [Deltaproteobacteria bacterium]|nr:cell division protein ZapA [Deltaproteobacteria bacterium]